MHLSGNVHWHCLSQQAEKICLLEKLPIHITACAVPAPSCRCHRSCAIVPVESRRCHRALQSFSCPWLCHRACANVPVPGLYFTTRNIAIYTRDIGCCDVDEDDSNEKDGDKHDCELRYVRRFCCHCCSLPNEVIDLRMGCVLFFPTRIHGLSPRQRDELQALTQGKKCSLALSTSTSRQIYLAAKQKTEQDLSGYTSQHVPCPCHCADAIVPVHRARRIMPATSFPCNCSRAVAVPSCLCQRA